MENRPLELLELLGTEHETLTAIKEKTEALILEMLKKKGNDLIKEKAGDLHRRTEQALRINYIERNKIINYIIGGADGTRN